MTKTQKLADTFKMLADPTRLALIAALKGGPRTVTYLCRKLRVPQPTASHHLGLLRRAGIVKTERDGKFVWYSLVPAALGKAAAFIG